MKKIAIILSLFAVLLAAGCSNETVEIDTLQIFGDEFYQGQKVDMGMSVKTSDPDNTYYEWWCEAGSFPAAQQGYPVMKWTAPKENGEFLIRCTVKCGGTKETREALVKVNGVFFDRFSSNEGNSTPSGWTATNQQARQRDGQFETHVLGNQPTDSLGWVTRDLGINPFQPPLSVTADVGISSSSVSPFNPKFPTKSETLYSDNFMGIGFTGRNPGEETAPTHYISELMVDWWPMDHYYDDVDYFAPGDNTAGTPRNILASDFDARLTVKVTRRSDPAAGIQQSTETFMVFFKSEAFKAGLDQTRNVGLSVESDYKVTVNVDGTDVFTSTALQDLKAAYNNAPLDVQSFKYIYSNLTMVYLDNLVVNDSAELLY